MNTQTLAANQLVAGMKVQDEFENIFTIVSDYFINSRSNRDVWTCSVSYAQQELSWGRIKIVANA